MSTLPKFAGNKKCWQHLNRLVFGLACQCPSCGVGLRENYRRRYLWCGSCRRKYRATAYRGSWLYGTKLHPRQLFVLLWCLQQRKSPDTARLLAGISYTTAARWYRRFREQLPDTSPELGGLVQIDESYFGKLRSRQPQTIVAGAIEPHTRRIALRITNSRGRDVLERFVVDHVRPGSLVVSDKWYAYEELPLLGYGHESWNHSTGQFAGTNQAEGIWSSMKRYLRKLYGNVPTKHLELICNEWMARQNQPGWFASPENYLRITVAAISSTAYGLMTASPIFDINPILWVISKLFHVGNGQGQSNLIFSGLQWKWYAAIFLPILTLALPRLAEVEEVQYRRGTKNWVHGFFKSLRFGLVHMIMFIPFGVSLALTLAGLWFTHQYFKGGVKRSTTYHAAFNTVLVVVAFIAFVLL